MAQSIFPKTLSQPHSVPFPLGCWWYNIRYFVIIPQVPAPLFLSAVVVDSCPFFRLDDWSCSVFGSRVHACHIYSVINLIWWFFNFGCFISSSLISIWFSFMFFCFFEAVVSCLFLSRTVITDQWSTFFNDCVLKSFKISPTCDSSQCCFLLVDFSNLCCCFPHLWYDKWSLTVSWVFLILA